MSDELLPPDLSLALDSPQNLPVVSEWLLGTSAVLAHHQGNVDTAQLIADVTSLEIGIWDTEFGREGYKVVLVVEPHLYGTYNEPERDSIADVMRTVLWASGKYIDVLDVRPAIPRLGPNWRDQVKTANGPAPNNQARRVRLEPEHPIEDGLHFTNEWEWKVYTVLKERQATLDDSDTIGIVPLPAMKVLKAIPVEPDFMITYRGRVGIIEVDGHYHRGPRSRADDNSRERLIRNAGVRQIDRIHVQDSTSKEEVEKFVTAFLKHLAG